MQQEYRNIGKLAATHGISGDMVLAHQLGQPLSLNPGEPLFIEQQRDSFIPFFVKEAIAKNAAETLIKFEDISTKEQAASLLKKQVYLTAARFKKAVAQNTSLALLGYNIINDDTQEALGQVEEVIELPQQLLIKVIKQAKEILLPLNESTLIEIDHKKEEIRLSLPEGLLDVYK